MRRRITKEYKEHKVKDQGKTAELHITKAVEEAEQRIAEERQAREEAEQRFAKVMEEAEQRITEERQARKEAEQRQAEAEQRLAEALEDTQKRHAKAIK